jgi:hypothetical protein
MTEPTPTDTAPTTDTPMIGYLVLDNGFNRANYPQLVGQVLDRAPAYAHVVVVHY